MRLRSRKTAKLECGSSVGTVCGSRAEAVQKIYILELTGGRNSQKINVMRPAIAKRLCTHGLKSTQITL